MHDIENERNMRAAAVRADAEARKNADGWRRAPELDKCHDGSEAWRHFWTGSVRWVDARDATLQSQRKAAGTADEKPIRPAENS